jgi:plasmid stability protein
MQKVTLLVHLDPQQKAALAERAALHGGSMSGEIRRALDAYLSEELSDEEEAALRMAAARAKAAMHDIEAMLDDMNTRLDRTFTEIAHIRGERP